jgi:hypothetical protein
LKAQLVAVKVKAEAMMSEVILEVKLFELVLMKEAFFYCH